MNNAAKTVFWFLFGQDMAEDPHWGMYLYGSLAGERSCRDGAGWRWRICTAWSSLRRLARGGTLPWWPPDVNPSPKDGGFLKDIQRKGGTDLTPTPRQGRRNRMDIHRVFILARCERIRTDSIEGN